MFLPNLEWLQQRHLAAATFYHINVPTRIFLLLKWEDRFDKEKVLQAEPPFRQGDKGKLSEKVDELTVMDKEITRTSWSYISLVHCCMFAVQQLVGSWWIWTSFRWAHRHLLQLAPFCTDVSRSLFLGLLKIKAPFIPQGSVTRDCKEEWEWSRVWSGCLSTGWHQTSWFSQDMSGFFWR